MGKYSESLGVWQHTICGIQHDIEPNMLDNDRVGKIINEYSRTKDQAMMLKKVGEYYFDLVIKAYPEMSEADREELPQFISINRMQIMEDVLVSHRWTTKEELAKAKAQGEDTLKNLTGAA